MHFKDLFVHRLKCIFYPNVFYWCVLYHIRITYVFIGSFICFKSYFSKKIIFFWSDKKNTCYWFKWKAYIHGAVSFISFMRILFCNWWLNQLTNTVLYFIKRRKGWRYSQQQLLKENENISIKLIIEKHVFDNKINCKYLALSYENFVALFLFMKIMDCIAISLL